MACFSLLVRDGRNLRVGVHYRLVSEFEVEGVAGGTVPSSLAVRLSCRSAVVSGELLFCLLGNFFVTYRERRKPWKVMEMKATPRTIVDTRSRRGIVSGSDAARTMDRAPLIPPRTAMCCQDPGTRSPSIREVPSSG